MKKVQHLLLALLIGTGAAIAQSGSPTSAFAITRLKYAGGGDWYNDPSSEVNLLTFVHRVTGIDTDPRYQFVDIADDGLYHCQFEFPAGVPKTHEHDGKAPQGFDIFLHGRLVLYYTYESNPSDGWADPEVHGDPEEKRQEALRFGTNLVVWVLTH